MRQFVRATAWMWLCLGPAALPLAARADDDFPPATATPSQLAFRVAKVLVMNEANQVIDDATVVVQNGKISAVGPSGQVQVPAGCRVLDFREHWLVPGFVDCHNHTAGSLGDLNDMVYQANPGLDSRATVQANNDLIRRARRGGVTTVLLIPGSGTNISGFGTICKTAGDTPDEVIVRSPGSLKIAQSGNPEWYFGGNGRAFMNWNTRQTLLKARDYHERWVRFERGETRTKPEFDPTFDGFRALFTHEMPASVHTQIYQVVMTTVVMLGQQLKLWVITDHSEMDGWKTAPLVHETPNVQVVQGPRSYHFDFTARRFLGNANGWSKNGVTEIGINTDSPVVPQEELPTQCTMGCWFGWLPYPALRGITANPAKALGLFDRLGSIEVGKDADLAIWTGNPIDPRSACLLTLVNGRIAYDGTKGLRRF